MFAKVGEWGRGLERNKGFGCKMLFRFIFMFSSLFLLCRFMQTMSFFLYISKRLTDSINNNNKNGKQ